MSIWWNLVLVQVTICLVIAASQNETTTERNQLRKDDEIEWKCPNITKQLAVECSCEFPHTLRCTGDKTALQVISRRLRQFRPGTISLLDITVSGTSVLPARFLDGVPLHGLVVSTGELKRVNENAFSSLARSLQALGLPNNLLESVPTSALGRLIGLDRLDLSHNKLKTLTADSFVGLTNLTYLDLSENLLSQLSPQAFPRLRSLKSLRMRGNQLSVSALSALRGLQNLEELDLSDNRLIGPTTPNLLPWIPMLRFLSVAGNELIKVQRGALQGLPNLTCLSLSNNQIDVLEDHAFQNLSTLTKLELANNRIVAVSSASLAHLDNLVTLDLTRNFLRSLTADLVLPLKNLQDIHLDDNDISMVSGDFLSPNLHLRKFSLSDNPLNCDCTLLDFANWLTNSTDLSDEDKASAVCATPPALENGVLAQVSPGSLLCGEPMPPPGASATPATPVQTTSDARLTLKDIDYDDSGLNLLWDVEPCSRTYTCDSLIIYETTEEDDETILESRRLDCESRHMIDPCSLLVSLPSSSLQLELGHKYRYCVAIIESLREQLFLVPGCSDVIALQHSSRRVVPPRRTPATVVATSGAGTTRISAVRTNVSDDGFLYVDVSLVGRVSRVPDCDLTLVVFSSDSIVHERKLNCSKSYALITDLAQGPYRVCATLLDTSIDEELTPTSHCVQVTVQTTRHGMHIELVLFAVVLGACILLVVALWAGKSILNRARPARIQGQCFLPAEEFEITHRARYVKLLTTTKV